MNRPPALLEALLVPLASLYGAVMNLRNAAYDREWSTSFDPGAPVLSIGNLTAGGTGKTPLTALLIEGFVSRGKRVGVVSRGYGGSSKGPARVPASGGANRAEIYGDEPSWLAARFPDLPVVVGADRVAASRALLSESPVDLIIADDAFQHRRLRRRMDAVVLDATEPAWHYRSLPLGRMREGFESLGRASAIFITKTNLAHPDASKWLLERVLEKCKSKPVVIELEARLGGLTSLSGDSPMKSPVDFENARLYLASGIGRPKTFRDLVEKETGAQVAGHAVYPDHHDYSPKDRNDILAAAKSFGASAIVVTEKDAVKLGGWTPEIPCWVTRLETRPVSGDMKEFYEAAGRILF